MPKVYIESLGCARNQVDSEVMLARLAAHGWGLADEPGDAEMIVVNTCSFIASATDESIDTILALAEYKVTGKCRQLIVAGCLPERFRQDSAKALPEVDLFLGTGAYDQVASAAQGGLAPGTCLLPDPDTIEIRTSMERKPFSAHMAYLKIAEGCSRGCTFCIIPKLRGRQKSRPMDAVVAEARELIAAGVKEIVLVAQETTAYGRDLPQGPHLPDLLDQLAGLDPSVWIRFLYGHPQTVTSTLVETVARHANLCSYFDIPVQHASDKVLRRMGRNYTVDELLQLFDGIRRKLPRAVLRTTLLVGFPGETEDDVHRLVQLVEHVRFDHLGVFTYSDAEDIRSHGLKGHVDGRVAQQRRERLMALQKGISEEKLERLNGKRIDVLVENEAEPGIYTARTMFQAPEVDGCVMVRSHQPLRCGTRINVQIVETHEYDLIGETR